MRHLVATIWIGLGLASGVQAGEVSAASGERGFLVGGDISMLTKIEQLGGVFREDGQPGDFLEIVKGHGCNCCRLRLFVSPNYQNAVVNDLPYTLELAKRIKAAGMGLLLNFHYSDTWADPGHQSKPDAWGDLDFEGLEKKVEDYTAAVIARFKGGGALPEIVQLGNEITPGMLWPEGRLGGEGDTTRQWDRFTRLLRAGIRGVQRPLEEADNVRIMIHIDRGGDRRKTKWFFENLNRRNLPYDLIGLSYYPWWHGPVDALRKNLHETAKAYRKDIVVVETAYPYRGQAWWGKKKNMDWPVSPEGQHAFLVDLIKTVREVPDNRGIGVLYWYPESIPVKGLRVWNGGATALFDAEGNALPGLKAFRLNPDAR